MKKYIALIIVAILLGLAYFVVKANSVLVLKGVTPEQAKVLYNPEGNVIQGNPKGKVTMVEFFGYNCRYCRKAYPLIQKFIKNHPEIRVVYKEYLLFGSQSKLTCYAALAAERQNKYLAMHDAMLTATKPLTEKEIAILAARQHMQVGQLFNDMSDPVIHGQITDVTDLMSAVHLQGAPTVIFVNSKVAKHPNQVKNYRQYYQSGYITTLALDKLLHEVEH